MIVRRAATALLLALGALLPVRALAAAVCTNPGKDGPAGALSGIVNSYYPGVSGTAGSTTVTVGSIDTSSGGASTVCGLPLTVRTSEDIRGNHTSSLDRRASGQQEIQDWFVAHQEPALNFTPSYPDLTVKQIWKDQEVNEAFQEVLDTPEFRAALDDPANKELLATPAFQKLLDKATG